MNLYVIGIGFPAAFVAGVVFSKYVLSEAASIKAHVTEEVSALRAEVAAALTGLAKKV